MSSVRPSIRNDPPTLDGELSEFVRIEASIGSKGTFELWFERKSHFMDFRGNESDLKDNLGIPCLHLCSNRLREHFECLLQAKLCLVCSLNSTYPTPPQNVRAGPVQK